MPRKKAAVKVEDETTIGDEAPEVPPATSKKRTVRTKKQVETTPISGVTKATVKKEIIEAPAPTSATSATRTGKRRRTAVSYDDSDSDHDAEEAEPSDDDDAPLPSKQVKKATRSPTKPAKKVTVAKATAAAADPAPAADGASKPAAPPKKKRKTADEKAADMAPLASRTLSHTYRIGAHVSAAGGVHQTIPNALQIGANAFACFLKSQRKWENPALKDEHATAFVSGCEEKGYQAGKNVVPHGSYLVNLANPDKGKGEQAYGAFVDDLKRCERLGIQLYNFHPGNTNGAPKTEALARLAGQLNRAHEETNTVVTLLENMAAGRKGDGNTLGGAFEDLATVISQVKKKDRVGVCLDTCHAFAAGYDLRSPAAFAATMTEFDEVVGNKYLRAVHLNDSKGPLASGKDLHQNIGLGFLGLRAFWNVMNAEVFKGLPMVLETPIDRKNAFGKEVEEKKVWAEEIKLLESLQGMDVEGEEFRRLERELSEKGTKERERLQEVVDRKAKEREKKAAKGAGKKRKKQETTDEEGSE